MTESSNETCDGRNRSSEVVFAIDETRDANVPNKAIIADIVRDDAWVAVDLPDAHLLEAWR